MANNMFGDHAVKLAKTPLGIIALFVLLTEVIAATIVRSSTLSDLNQTIIVLFITVFPVLVVGMFWHLVVNHNVKLYSPSEFPNHSDFLTANKVDPTHLLEEFKKDVIADIERSASDAGTQITTINEVNLQTNEYLRAVQFLRENSLSKEEALALAALSEEQLEKEQAENRFGSSVIKKLKDLNLVDNVTKGATSIAKTTDFAQLISRLIV